jgi:DNA replication protein DnaC
VNAEVVAAQVKLYAKELKMPGLAGAFEEVVRDAQKAGRAHLESLAACLAAEVASRTEHRLAARIKAARFPALKSFESFDFSLLPSLEKGRVLALGSAAFTAAKENVVCLGASGTGKTHVASAIGLAAIYSGARVRFTTAITLAAGAARRRRRSPPAALPEKLAQRRPGDRRRARLPAARAGSATHGPVLRRALRGRLGTGHDEPRVQPLG